MLAVAQILQILIKALPWLLGGFFTFEFIKEGGAKEVVEAAKSGFEMVGAGFRTGTAGLQQAKKGIELGGPLLLGVTVVGMILVANSLRRFRF